MNQATSKDGSSQEAATVERMRASLRRERRRNNNLILAMLESRDALEGAREDYRGLERDASDDYAAAYWSRRAKKIEQAITTTYAAHENYGH